ncbi:MAG: Sodium-dependent dicarboxylate transporter SdcS [Owenweeksia sp. TMED14]|nr:MAG: Sodium-dependent dicarboxylate transporter SdcS [Owenweeksia sp. TMED14]
MLNKKRIGLILGPLFFLLILFFFKPEGLSPEANAVLASTLWIATWWVTEAIPIEVTALLPIVLFPLFGALGLKETGAAYGHKFIFLFIGGFILAIAIEKWQLHKRIALHIIKFVGTSLINIMLGFMLSTALLSMWISNTATTVMMLPIGMAVIAQLNEKTSELSNTGFGKALMLSIAYSASIGGMATIIGTPPNLIFAGVVQELYGIEISFLQWFTFGLPISILLLFICWIYLGRFAFSLKGQELPGGRALIEEKIKELGIMSREEKLVSTVFALTAISWICRSFLLKQFIVNIDDTIIAVIAAIALFIIPSKKKGEALLNWQDAVKLPWGILLLFGGGIALAIGFESSGLAFWVGNQLTALQGTHLFLLVFVIIASVNFLTEITSNLATTAILLPILATLAVVVDIHPFMLLAAATVAASCAFMLPVATAPNALVFGSGYIKMGDMIKSGVWLNLISIIILTLIVYFFLPIVWNFDPYSF